MDQSIYLPPTNFPRIVVIGVGFAGLEFAKKLKGKDYQVILVDQNNFHQFPPLFYQVATSGLEPDSISFSTRRLFRKANNVFFRMAKVQEIDAINNQLKTDKGLISFDYLVIATGTTNNFYGMQEVEQNSIGMKTIQEALDVRSLVLQNLENATDVGEEERRDYFTNIVICGGGPAGVELAGAFAEFKNYVFQKDYKELTKELLKIYLIEGTDKLLSVMSEKSSTNALKVLERFGVIVKLNSLVKNYDGEVVTLNTGEQISGATLIWTAGVQGNFIDGLTEATIEPGRRLAVDGYFHVTGYDHIFAIGDIAYFAEENWPKAHPQVAPAAIQHGKFLANYFLSQFKNSKVFSYYDKGQLATIGMKHAVLDKGKIHIQGYLGWLIWATVHLISISGFNNRIRVALNWLGSYFRYDKRNRLIIRKYQKNKTEN